MLILLPPSEGKTAPRSGKPVDLSRLAFPELTEAREQVLDELIAVSAGPAAPARLKVAAGLADVVAANTGLREAPSAAASAVYTGVLFDALGFAGLPPAAKRRAGKRVLIFSALFGVLRPGDRIPAYRLGGSVTLPGTGGLGGFWRGHLDPVLGDPPGLIVDCRSSAYAAMWRPSGALGVRVLREEAGRRSVVTHMAKHARGLIARALCEEPGDPPTPEALVDLLDDHFAATVVRTATGAEVRVRVEQSDGVIDVITS